MNPLYQQQRNNIATANNPDEIMKQLQRFSKTINGDPQHMVQQLLNSGKVSQDQYNSAVQIAKRLQQFLTGAQQ